MSMNLGVTAVIGFYILSGYLMASSYTRFREHGRPIFDYYKDRFYRIYPIFFIVFIVTIGLSYFGFIETRLDEPNPIKNIFLELLIIPQNFYFFGQPFTINVIPPAWSLGAEMQWYLLVPFIVLVGIRIKVLLLIILLLGQDLAFLPNLSGLIDFHSNDFCQLIGIKLEKCHNIPDLLGYRMLIFVMVTFLLGNLIFDSKKYEWLKGFMYLIYIHFILNFFIFSNISKDFSSRFSEVYLGYLILFPLIFFIVKSKNENNWDRYDKLIGRFAYPVFLCHFLSFWITDSILYLGLNKVIVTWSLIFSLSAILVIIQNYVDSWRYRKRGFVF